MTSSNARFDLAVDLARRAGDLLRPGLGRASIEHKSPLELVTEFDPVIGEGAWLPKETWTADCALAEYRQGRKTLIYVRQTGERDVQERLKACLESRGPSTGSGQALRRRGTCEAQVRRVHVDGRSAG